MSNLFSYGKAPIIMEALLGVIGIRNIWRKNYRDMGYLGGKLEGFGIFKKDSGISKIEVLMF